MNNKIIKALNNIGVKITFFLFLIASTTMIINVTLNRSFIYTYFLKIENQNVISMTDKSRKILKARINDIETLVEEYAFWDENYNKIQEENIDETWFKENITDWIPKKYNLDLTVVVNKNKNIIAQHGLNNINEFLDLNKLFESLTEEKYTKKNVISGYLKYDGDLYIISSCPIFKNTCEGSCRGVVIIGKKASSSLLASLAEQLGSDIFINYDNKFILTDNISKEVNESIKVINKNINNPVYRLNDFKTIGSFSLIDIAGNNIGTVNNIQPRDMFLETERLSKMNALFSMVLSIIVIFILGLRFQYIIANPIKNLKNQIKKMELKNLLIHVNSNSNATNEIIELAESFNNMVDAIHNREKEMQELKIYANTDSLTSVYNHKYYFESIKEKIAEGHKQISIMFCDIDKFKLANDTYGHEIGDFILRKTAEIIKDEVKDKGMVFRYGGEEFVVIMCDYTSLETLIKAEKIRENVANNNNLQEYADYFPITISIGIASYPNHSLYGEGLIKKADNAMYYSKHCGRNQCNIYNNSMDMFSKDSNKDTHKELLMDSVLALAEAVDAKDDYTGKHSKMVSKYSILLAEKLGFTENEKNMLRIGALLHDCGKIGVPDNIIHKPTKLSEEEFLVIKNHSLLGYNIIRHITDDEEIMCCIRSHHERWDGKGYPDGLSGNSIHLFARIVCIADVYHAMTSDRSYRTALTQEKVIDEFIKSRGTQFDPRLVDIFIEIIKDSLVEKSI